jgi:Uma2 family endonuclease
MLGREKEGERDISWSLLTIWFSASYNGEIRSFAMKAVLAEVPPFVLAWRKQTGAEMWDEMWEGVLHMAPVPSRSHQDFKYQLLFWLNRHWAKPLANRVHGEVNLASPGGWPRDYRIPDLILLTPDRFGIDHDVYFEGPPTVVIEIESPGDETAEKISFYAQLGVPETWIFHRDTKRPRLLTLQDGVYRDCLPDAKGWLVSPATGIRFQHDPSGKLILQYDDDPATKEMLPE